MQPIAEYLAMNAPAKDTWPPPAAGRPPSLGKSEDMELPTTYALPPMSSVIALPVSPSLPPRYVEYSRPEPAAFSTVKNALVPLPLMPFVG